MNAPDSTAELGMPPTTSDLRRWITAHVAAQARRAPAEIRADLPLADYGLDSVYAATLAADLEDALGIDVDPGLTLAHDSIERLAGALTDLIEKERTGRA